MAVAQGEAADAEHVLQKLGETAVSIREKLGEAIGSLSKYNTPIEQATTSSLEALKAYSAGQERIQHEDPQAAVPFFLRAVELDPDFVAAYDNGSWAFLASGNPVKASEFATQAFRRRSHATELEQLSAEASYQHMVTGNLEEEARLSATWARLFPNDWTPYSDFPFDYPPVGRLADVVDAAKTIVRLNPNIAQGYRFLVTTLVPLQRYDEAAEQIAKARTLGLDNQFVRQAELSMFVATDNEPGVAAALERIKREEGPRAETTWRARLAVSAGRWRAAADLYRQAQPPSTTGAATPLPLEAVANHALLGFCEPAEAARVLSRSRIVVVSGNAYAPAIGPDGDLCGDVDAAEAFVAELTQRFPESTISRELSVPQLRAAIALRQNKATDAIEALHVIRAEGLPDVYRSYYLRGQAHLRAHQNREAAADFQMILDHRGWFPTSVLYPLAHLGLARALSADGDAAGARKQYEEFFAGWKDADAGLPVLASAKADYNLLAAR